MENRLENIQRKKGLHDENRELFSDYVQDMEYTMMKVSTLGRLTDVKTGSGQLMYLIDGNGDTEIVIIEDKSGREIYFDLTNGVYVDYVGCDEYDFIQWLSDKSNKRRYKKFSLGGKDIMLVDYWLKIALDAKIKGTVELKDKFTLFNDGTSTDKYEINHIDGDTYNNETSNLEVVTSRLNKCHSRLMCEINYYYPEIVELVGINCNESRMHRFVDKSNRIDCSKIDSYNNRNVEVEIKAYVDKKGEFRARFSLRQIDEIIKYFNIKKGAI